MTQPNYVPISGADQVRGALRLRQPPGWKPTRPGELKFPVSVGGSLRGAPGPDQGFALHLAQLFEPKLVLAAGEHVPDLMAACSAQAMRRAALWGRAPMLGDCEAALTLWGCLAAAPDDLVGYRKELFLGAAHDYSVQRRICDRVPKDVAKLSAAEIRDRLEGPGGWRALLPAS